MNPQGTLVISFKQPSKSETAHDFLWRAHVRTPGKGQVVIFNRSHYEDVLVVRVQSSVRLFKRSAEGDHNDNILEPDFFTHLPSRSAFEHEAGAIAFTVVAAGAAPPKHRIFLMRLELPPADERSVLVGFEVAQAHNHRIRVTRRSYPGNTRGERVDEILGLVGKPSR